MRVDVVTLFPEFVDSLAAFGVLGRARRRGLVDLRAWNPREFSEDRHRNVDDRPYGGGPGMVMMIEPLRRTLHAVRADRGDSAPVLYLSPQGPVLDQQRVQAFAAGSGFTLLCGRYEGIDERLLQREIDAELSIGDYVLSGGEPAAAVVIDAVVRLLPGALGDEASADQDSFSDGLLDCGHWTRPEHHPYGQVPEVLLSGDHARIARWRRQQSLGRTWEKRPDLLAKAALDATDHGLLEAYIAERTRAV